MITQNEHDRLTLQQYLQTYNIKKKIEERKHSKQKNKEPMIKTQQQQKMDGIFVTIDQFLEQTKIELEDILINTDIHRERVFFYVSKLLDGLMLKLKDQISKMYKDVYRHYLLESKEQEVNINHGTADYFKEKMEAALHEKKKANIGEVIKQNFKREEKNAFIAKLIIGDHFNTDNFMDNNVQNNVKEQGQTKPQVAPQNQMNKQLTIPIDKGSNKRILSSGKQQDKQEIKQSNLLKQPAKQTAEPKQQPRGNSFMQALFGLIQKESQKPPLPPPPVLIPISSDIQSNVLPMTPKDSKLARPFERKQSVKQMLQSPKGKKLLKATSPH